MLRDNHLNSAGSLNKTLSFFVLQYNGEIQNTTEVDTQEKIFLPRYEDPLEELVMRKAMEWQVMMYIEKVGKVNIVISLSLSLSAFPFICGVLPYFFYVCSRFSIPSFYHFL